MPLSLEDLLAEPTLSLRLAAGGDALASCGPVRWVHISELPDPTPWLEGGEVLLTTGLGVQNSPQLQRRLIEGLRARDCTAVGFGLGVVMPEVPPAMLEAADRAGLALFTVPYEVPFLAVTKFVSAAVFEEHYAAIRSALRLHRRILAAVTSKHGIAAVIELAAHQLPEFGFVVLDYYGNPLELHDPQNKIGPLHRDCLWNAVAQGAARDSACEVHREKTTIAGSRIRIDGQLEAVLAIVGDRPLDEHDRLLLEQGIAGVTLTMARELSIRELNRGLVDELLESVATGRSSTQLISERLARLGVGEDQPFRVICVPGTTHPSLDLLCGLVEDAIMCTRPVVGRWDDCVYALVDPDEPLAESIAEALRYRGWPAVVGRSRPRATPEGLAPAIREARTAAQQRPSPHADVQDIEQLDVAALLHTLHDSDVARPIVDRNIGPLIEHDDRTGSNLVKSLATFLRHACRPGPAADELCIHRHTLTYRLDRIRELTGRDPRDGAHLLDFTLALQLHLASGTR